jgi:hypothetical protein
MKLFAASFLIAMNLMLVVGVNLPMPELKTDSVICEHAVAAENRRDGWDAKGPNFAIRDSRRGLRGWK